MSPSFFDIRRKGCYNMEYNGKKGVHTTTFLNEVHAVMSAKYLANQSQDVEEAKKLQDFFQTLKKERIVLNLYMLLLL